MTERLSKLGVTRKAIDAFIAAPNLFETDPVSFVKQVVGKIREEQPALYTLVDEMLQHGGLKDPHAYALGVTLTYKVLPQILTLVPLTVDEIGAMLATLAEHTVARIKDGKQEAGIDLSWFGSKLQEDSPDFMDLLESVLEKDEDSQGSFLLGTIQVAMPFFMREEAREMDQEFFGGDEENKQK